MTERLGIEIDYCPQCRGVWLDRGELDKIIERSMGDFVQKAPVAQAIHQAPSQYDRGQDNHDNHDNHDYHHENHQGYRGKQSFWKDLFD
jgi:Zn-finger nucleic acid-binding protein